MKQILGILLVLSTIFIFGACGSNVDSQNGGDSTSELLAERYVYEEGGFSFQPPKDWEMKDTGLEYQSFLDTSKNDFWPSIIFVEEEYSGSLKDYVSANITSLKNSLTSLKIVKQSDFSTLSGQEGTKLIVTDEQSKMELQQTFYFFELNNKTKIVVTCTSLADKAAETDALFEESASTFKLEK